ncbi:MAG: nucleotide pyrophosphatase, partial [Spartobacteria bacterium]|nr:nucleotide pyrophosphatase [Spartobacteria bacterium]
MIHYHPIYVNKSYRTMYPIDTTSIIQGIPTFILGYIGPGAGFAFLGSFLIVLVAIAMVILALLSWPFRLLIALCLRRGKKRARTPFGRVVIVGLDGLDPGRCRDLMGQGRLPHFSALAEEGSFRDLPSTCPPISPVAWSSFMTGVNPGKHNIFDFLNRSKRTYLPELSSSRVENGKKAQVKLLRKSKPFWHVLGEYGVFSTILRVPITFPPEPFNGLCLSGMCVPDLRGSQGSFTCYSTVPSNAHVEGGERVHVTIENDRIRTTLSGPPGKDGKPVCLDFEIEIAPDRSSANLLIDGQRVPMKMGEYTDWVRLRFPLTAFKKVYGLCRFRLEAIAPEFKLYVTPINIDPEHPCMPVTHPDVYAIYLAKLHGPFATLGLAEDTWALSEGVIDDDTFLEQAYAIHDERERMFFDALARTRKGVCVCVFDASDRIQHMFMRQSAMITEAEQQTSVSAINTMYERMDAMVGRVRAKLKANDVLMVISDHGFTDFRRGVNLNIWLREKGLLHGKEGHENEDYLQSVDWAKTQLYTFGLSGIYVNKAGREAQGIVTEEQWAAMKQAIIRELKELKDPKTGEPAIHEVHDAQQAYTGPYKNNGPDLIIGYHKGYRASWDAAVGKT